MKRTAQEIIEQSFSMLGYDSTPELIKRAVTAVNIIAMDIFYISNTEGFKPVRYISDTLDFPEEIINDTIPHGVASHIAEMMDDGEKQQIYTAYYNRKRMKINVNKSVIDVFEGGEGFEV